MSQTPDWLRLQRKIFSRWVNQKLMLSRGIPCNDVVTELDTGILLKNLVEVLSEKTFNEKLSPNPKLRVHKVDNLSRVLKWVYGECGIHMKIQASPENLIDGDEKDCLGLIWAIMLKFLRFGDDEDEEDGGKSLNAKDSLLMWVQNKTASYGLNIQNFQKNFHDGLALCAIIHKHRPQLINWESLNAANGKENVAIAMNAAEKYFGLEKYLSVDDFFLLDENSMVIYVSEYYYGIAEQRKMDLAARRIKKVITFTIENDALRKEYTETASNLCVHLEKVEKVLGDRTIDNTLAGARARLEAFYDYKKNDKSAILGDQLNLESLYNNLAMRLAHHKRPEFVPPQGCSLKDIEARLKSLEVCETERKVALHAELNRQLRLVRLNEQHESSFNKLKSWLDTKDAYTNKVEEIDSVGAAQFQLKVLEAFNKENGDIKANRISYLLKLGAELVAEKYENSANVQQREATVSSLSAKVDQQAVAKNETLNKALQLEIRKEELRQEFADKAAGFIRFTSAAAENLETFFGFSLEEVEAFGSFLEKDDAKRSSEAESQYSSAVSVFEEGQSIGITENRYTTWTVNDLTSARDNLTQALAARKQKYLAELERQRRCDALCKQFAEVADPFAAAIIVGKDSITASKDSLEDQLANVQSKLANLDTATLERIKSLQAELDGEQITNNKYTLLTAKDCEAQHDQYVIFLQRKDTMLQKEIENEKLRGVSAEQLKEIQDNFQQFDANKDGLISRRELKACLYSLGEEKNRSEVTAIIEKYGNSDGQISHDSFVDFMTIIYGDAETKDEILDGFKLIARGKDTATKENLEFVMDEDAVQYITTTAPESAGQYDYSSWTEDVFSR